MYQAVASLPPPLGSTAAGGCDGVRLTWGSVLLAGRGPRRVPAARRRRHAGYRSEPPAEESDATPAGTDAVTSY